MGNQSRKGWFKPKIARKLSEIIFQLFGKPSDDMSSNLENPPERRFMSIPKTMKVGMNPNQKRFSLVASKIPLLAITKSSSHFLQFIIVIIA